MSGARAGAGVGAALVAAAVAVHLPLRIAAARLQETYGARFSDHLLGGLASDLAVLLPTLLALWAALLGALLLLRRGRPAPPPAAAAAAVALLALAHALLLLGGIAAAEFRVQRGLWPTPWDVGTSAGDAGFWSSAAGALAGAHALPAAAALAALLAAHAWVLRALRRPLRALPFLLASLLVLAAAYGVSRVAFLRSAKGLFPTVHDREAELLSPLRHFVRTAGLLQVRDDNSWLSASAWLRQAAFPDGDLQAGAALLGLPPATAAGAGAPAFRRLLPGEEPDPTPLTGAALDLSRALFAGRDLAPDVLEISLESVRAADVHALDEAAPRGIAPFLTSLHDGRHGLPLRGAGARRAFQGGIRTSHALAGSVCGLGSLPFTWSAARDFGILPARCLTDLLADAGYAPRFFTAGALAFDNMGTFFRSHGVRPFGGESVPREAPRGAWGATDRGAFRWVLGRLAADPTARPRWDLVISLTNHGPYAPPPDLPQEVTRRVDAALAGRAASLGREERDRLLTLSYTDFALEELLRGFAQGRRRARTIVVVHADHASAEPSPWREPGRDPARRFLPEAARIPLVVLFPEEFLRDAADPAAAAAALERFGGLLGERPVSGNDVPGLLLALLSSAAPLRDLPEGKRWHTLGGQATSPWFSFPGNPEVRVWGVDAFSRLFALDARGKAVGVREPVAPVSSPAEVGASPSAIRPAAAVIRRLLEPPPGP